MGEAVDGEAAVAVVPWRENWPAVRPSWVMFEARGVLAINKPEGVPGPKPAHPTPWGIVERTRSYLRAAGNENVTLGVHHHLGVSHSGLLVFGRTKDGNRALAKAFEGREVQAEFVVGVVGWPAGRERMSLQADTRRQRGGRSRGRARVLKAKAVCVRQSGSRALVKLSVKSTNPVAVQGLLSAAGLKVAGATGARDNPTSAHRLMLHLGRLRFSMEGQESGFDAETETPVSFYRWLDGGLSAFDMPCGELVAHLDEVMERRWARLQDEDARTGRAAFRWAHREADGVAGLALDVYGDHAVLHLYESVSEEKETDFARALVKLGFAGVYVKRRPLRANELAADERAKLAPTLPIAGVPDAARVLVENGVRYDVALGDGLSTGIFLDQRNNRRRLMEVARGGRVLNLFAYTGAFSVAAAEAGAVRTVSVDASGAALARAEQMLKSFEGEHLVVKNDAFAYLPCSEPFDVVVVDPPTHSTVGGRRWSSGRDWVDLVDMCSSGVVSGGWLLACSNDSRMTGAAFVRRVQEGVTKGGRKILELESVMPESDFPPHPSRGYHLKSVWVRIG